MKIYDFEKCDFFHKSTDGGSCSTNRQMVAFIFPQIDRWWFLFFPNDLRCGFRKLKERGVGNRTSGAALVPKSLLLLLLLLRPRSRPRPDFTYTKNLRYQNQHGMDLHGQSDRSPSCFGPRVAFFCRTGVVGLQAIDAFSTF